MAVYSHPWLDVLLDIAVATLTILTPAAGILLLIACLYGGTVYGIRQRDRQFGVWK